MLKEANEAKEANGANGALRTPKGSKEANGSLRKRIEAQGSSKERPMQPMKPRKPMEL